MLRRRVVIVGALAMFGLVGAACTGSHPTGGGAAPAPSRLPEAPSPAPVKGEGPILGVNLPAIQAHVVKTATVGLELRKGSFDRQFQLATQIAGRHGGYVESSESATGKLRSGVLVIRVPAAEFEVTLGEVKGLGKVTSQKISGQDVTTQYVDLQARLRNWQAQEKVLLGLMRQTSTIEDSLRVQRELQDVQLQIEELQGQLNVLGNQADLSTITADMAETGFVPPKPKAQPGALSKAWHDAVRGFLGVIAAVIVALAYLIPLGLLVLLGLAIWFRLVKPRVPGPKPRIPPAPVPPVA